MKKYYKVMLGRGSSFSEEAKAGGYIGADFLNDINLKQKLPENWRDFNKEFIPVWLKQNPGKTRIGAGLACGQLWTVIKGIQVGDWVLSPTGRGSGTYMVGEVTADYEFYKSQPLQHRRAVNWFSTVDRNAMSESLRNSSGGITTVIDLSKYTSELDLLIENPSVQISISDDTVEDPSVFALESHLEEFLVSNWAHTELGKKYNIYESDGELIGKQYPTDTGPLDILAVSKDGKELLVVELKKGRISDVVVGQILRYMSYIREELAEKGQTVHGLIIGLEDDIRIRRAISETKHVDYMTYQVKFRLTK
jgi:restriction system protein